MARFGVFELDLRSAELRRDGVRVKLQEQPFRLLAALVQRPGEIVTREELRQTLWPSEFVDFDQSLNAAVRKLRTALDDSAENPRFVETLARRGYRFIAPVSWVAGPRTPARRRHYTVPIAIAAVLVLAAAAFLFFRQRTVPRAAIDTVAVLPFTIDDKQNEHLSDGLTEMLIDNLSRLPNLRVIARTTVFRYKDSDLGRAARELGVSAVVTGRIRRERDRYTIRVELIDVRDNTQIWGDRFDGGAPDLPSLQNQISEELSLRLRRGVGRERYLTATANPQAYDEHLKGLYAFNKRELKKALEHFNRAVEYDPGFAGAWAGIANVYGVMVGYGQLAPEDGVPKTLAAARRALELDPDNAEALTCVASTKYRNLWDFPGAEHDYRRAIASNPNYATAHQWYADYLRSMGRFAEAHRENESAYKLDPFAISTNAMMCYALVYERKYDQALAFTTKAAELDPQLSLTKCRVKTFIIQHDFDSAVSDIEKEYPRSVAAQQMIAQYRSGGPRSFVRGYLEFLESMGQPEVNAPTEIAEAYAALGDRDQAFAWLEKAYAHRVSRLTNVNVEPGFDSLRDDPRYDDLLRRIGLPKIPIPGS